MQDIMKFRFKYFRIKIHLIFVSQYITKNWSKSFTALVSHANHLIYINKHKLVCGIAKQIYFTCAFH